MPLVLAKTPLAVAFAFALTIFSPSPSHALMEWAAYRTKPVIERTKIDESVAAMLESVEKTNSGGFKTQQINFCAQKNQIWETSVNASCSSTASGSKKYVWPPVLTNEGANFEWIALTRFATVFCEKNPAATVCSLLELETSSKKTALRTFVDMVLPMARADEGFDRDPDAIDLSPVPAPVAAPPPMPAPVTFCKVQTDVITTKSGKKIFLDFGVQPAEKHANLLHSTAAMAASDKTKIALQDNLGQLKKMGSVIIENFNRKRPWVLERIKNDQVTWIGTEQSAGELGPRGGLDFASSFDDLGAKLARKTTKSLADEAMISGACPSASVCTWLHDSHARNKVKLVPLEADEDKQKTLAILKDIARIFKDLDVLVSTGVITKDELGFITREYTNMMIVAEISADPKEREKVKRRHGRSDVSQAVAGFYDNAVALKKISHERQRSMVLTALAQNSNGILAVGNNHKANMVPLLESLCDNPNPAPAAPPKGRAKRPATTKKVEK